MAVVVASGYFDPLHIGHIEYLKKSKAGENTTLIVIVNNNKQKILKAGKYFMDENERMEIIKSLKFVDYVFLSLDEDRSVCKTLEYLHKTFNIDYFTNGGDVTNKDCLEKETCNKLGILMIDGLGKKIQSSSNLTKDKV